LEYGSFYFAENMISDDPRDLMQQKKSLFPFNLTSLRLVKGLGTTIGTAPRVGGVSDFDGDGDGFLTGPDGQDNVPAPQKAVEKLVRPVADVLKATDDLMEARKTGRPWKPITFDALSKEDKEEWGDILQEVQKRRFERGQKARRILDDVNKKYGGGYLRHGFFDWRKFEQDHPNVKIDLQGNSESDIGKDADLVKRMRDFDKKSRERMMSAFDAERAKAQQRGSLKQFDRAFKNLKDSMESDDGVDRFASRIIDDQFGVYHRSYQWGFSNPDDNGDFNFINPFKELDQEQLNDAVGGEDRRVVVAVRPHVLEKMLEDGRLKSFFESKKNGFFDSYDEHLDKSEASERKRWYLRQRLAAEQRIFGIPAKAGSRADRRPIYGFFMPNGLRSSDATNDDSYGGIMLVMKRSVEDRTSFTAQDSMNGQFWGGSPINAPSPVSMVDLNGRVYESRTELDDNFDKPYGRGDAGYTEAQIFGGVSINDVAYVAIMDDTEISADIERRLNDMGIPVVVHKEKTPFKESPELHVKEDVSAKVSDSYVLFATDGDNKIFIPEERNGENDLHGMVSIAGKKRKRIENVSAYMKFGDWEIV